MEKAAKDKDPCTRRVRTPASSHQWRIDVSSHEMIDRFVPRPPVDSYAWAVPSVRIEFPIAKLHYFG